MTKAAQSNRNMDKKILHANFRERSMEAIRHDFSNEEIIQMKNDFFQVSSMKTAIEEVIKQVKQILSVESDNHYADLKEAIDLAHTKTGNRGLKNLLADFNSLMAKINKGYEIREVMVYQIDYTDEGRIEYFDEEGTFLYERKIAGRHQMHILSKTTVKSSTNDK